MAAIQQSILSALRQCRQQLSLALWLYCALLFLGLLVSMPPSLFWGLGVFRSPLLVNAPLSRAFEWLAKPEFWLPWGLASGMLLLVSLAVGLFVRTGLAGVFATPQDPAAFWSTGRRYFFSALLTHLCCLSLLAPLLFLLSLFEELSTTFYVVSTLVVVVAALLYFWESLCFSLRTIQPKRVWRAAGKQLFSGRALVLFVLLLLLWLCWVAMVLGLLWSVLVAPFWMVLLQQLAIFLRILLHLMTQSLASVLALGESEHQK